MSIIIFSGPIHSGKTTALKKYCEHYSQANKIGGILMPDVDGRRRILDIATDNLFDIECADPENTSEELITVGRFHFFQHAFDKANAIIQQSLAICDTVIIDEAGKLELSGNGLFRSITAAIASPDFQCGQKELILVVRESLYNEVVSYFSIPKHSLLNSLE